MVKLVNIKPVVPILALKTPIMGQVMNCKMTEGDILQCIYSRAFVDEVLEDGTLVRLNLTNYNKDNSHLMKNKIEKTKICELPEEKQTKDVIEPETTTQTIKEAIKTIETNEVESKIEETTEKVNEVIEDVVTETITNEEEQYKQKKNKKNRR